MGARIRLATETDAEGMLEIYTPVVLETAISFEEEPPTLEEFRSRIRAVLERMPWLVCMDGHDIAGYAYASLFRMRAGYRWTAELTVYVHPAHHCRGVGRALYTALLRCLAVQGYLMAVAIVSLPYAASIGLHETMGFRRTGVPESIGHKHGRWIDDDVWQIEIQPIPVEPPNPVPLRQLIGTPEWDNALESGAALLND